MNPTARALWPFNARCALVGMVHLLPLPGSPRWGGDPDRVIEAALRDARALAEGGCDGLIVENMHDVPYLKGRVEPETVALMAIVAREVRRVGLPMGVQVLAGANREALAVAVASGARWIRAEAFAYGHVADEGWMEATAGELTRARRFLDARVGFWADVRKKHAAHAPTADLDLRQLCEGHAFCGADALVITGEATGRVTSPDDVRVARSCGLPVVVGSGVEPSNLVDVVADADALVVGSWIKQDGDWRRPVDDGRVAWLRDALDRALVDPDAMEPTR